MSVRSSAPSGPFVAILLMLLALACKLVFVFSGAHIEAANHFLGVTRIFPSNETSQHLVRSRTSQASDCNTTNEIEVDNTELLSLRSLLLSSRKELAQTLSEGALLKSQLDSEQMNVTQQLESVRLECQRVKMQLAAAGEKLEDWPSPRPTLASPQPQISLSSASSSPRATPLAQSPQAAVPSNSATSSPQAQQIAPSSDEPSMDAEFFDAPNSALPPASGEAQRLIAANQNPASCSNARYAIYLCGSGCGLGCQINLIAAALQRALFAGRVFLLQDGCGSQYAQGPSCAHSPNLECFFLPLSRCTLADVNPQNSVTVARLGVNPPTEDMSRTSGVPPAFQQILSGRRLRPDEADNFIKMQCVAYVMRLQPSAITAMSASFLPRIVRAEQGSSGAQVVRVTRGAGPQLMQDVRSSVSVLVRHGDKGSEMKLQPARVYLQNSTMWLHELALQSGTRLSRSIFYVTDDQEAVDEALAVLPPGWALYYMDFPRLVNDPLNSAAGQREMAALNLTIADIFRRQLFDVLVSAHAGAHAGTLGSNLCRLIFALRCAWHSASPDMPVVANLLEPRHDLGAAIIKSDDGEELAARLPQWCPLAWPDGAVHNFWK